MNRPSPSTRFDRPAPARFSAEEFLRMADLGAFEDMKVELDHGEIVRMNPPFAPHGSAVAQIIVAFSRVVRGGEVFVTGEAAVRLSEDTVYAFDAALIRGPAPQGAYEPHQLTLAVEVADTSLNRDLGRKSDGYARAGVRHYWVVDVNAKVIHVMGDAGEGYGKRDVVRFGEPLELPDGLGTITLD